MNKNDFNIFLDGAITTAPKSIKKTLTILKDMVQTLTEAGDLKCKTCAFSSPDLTHCINDQNFQDQTGLVMEINPDFGCIRWEEYHE